MRVIGQISGAKQAYLLTTFLTRQGIEATAEKRSQEAEDAEVFDIWVVDEEQLAAAKEHLARFLANPDDPSFAAIDEAQKPEEPSLSSPLQAAPDQEPLKVAPTQRGSSQAAITRLIVMACLALFAWGFFQPKADKSPQSETELFISQPLFRMFAFDVSGATALKIAFFRKHNIESSAQVATLSEQAQKTYREIDATPTWKGLYTLILNWPASKKELSAPLFGQIAKGQIWRLVTPVLLHGGFLHILFNMLWLWTLGKQLEERIKKWQYLAITLILAVVSNTTQYLVSGPLFLGYSGILCGMVGFIWMRQRMAPWEGYPLHPVTITFLSIFVLGLFALQLVSFSLALLGKGALDVGMFANSAHLSGGDLWPCIGSDFPFFQRIDIMGCSL